MSRSRAAVLSAATATICLLAAVTQAAQTDAPEAARGVPDAKMTFRGRTATVGVGFTWGASTLEYQGQTYPVRIDGFVLGSFGSASIEGVGEVFGLSKVEDLNGDYTAVATGLTLGRGRGALVMRNDKGVRIVIDATSAGLQIGVGPRGFTLSVGEAGGPPAEAGARFPQTLAFGEAKLGPLFVRPTLNAQIYVAAPGNAGFDGEWSFGPVDEVDHYVEHSNEIGLNLRQPLGEDARFGTLQARVSGIYSLTGSGPDGPVCNGGQELVNEYTLESGYLAWKSGNLFPDLGFNAIELSGGNQNYQVFDGLLFWDGGQDCANRGGNWVSARKAFQNTAILKVTFKHLTLEGVHLEYNDNPDTDTRLGAARVEYVTDDLFMEHLKLGLMYFNIYRSDTATRDGMDGVYFYHEATPLPFLPDFSYKTAWVRESNSESSGLTEAFGWYVGLAYELSKLPWQPRLGYRYASFSGGDTRSFDSLFTGLPDWGSWFQGELLGEYVLSNSNLNSHQVRLTVKPHEIVTANLIYYKFLLDDKDQAFGVVPTRVNRELADEVDLIVDVALTNWWSIAATFAVAVPNQGFRQAVDGSSTWFNGYLYMNFNF